MILERTKWGNWIFATGGNLKAASSRGVNPKRVKSVNFVLTSFLAGLGGLIQACRITAILPNAGIGLELNTIVATVIGGAQLTGGVGSIVGATIGGFLVRVINNALISLGIPGYWFRVFVGMLIIGAVVLNLVLASVRTKLSRRDEIETTVKNKTKSK